MRREDEAVKTRGKSEVEEKAEWRRSVEEACHWEGNMRHDRGKE